MEEKSEPEENVTLLSTSKPLRSSMTKDKVAAAPSGLKPKSGWESDGVEDIKLGRKESWTKIYSPDEIKKSREMHRRVVLNVGGDRHEILWEKLFKYPYTRLGHLKQCDTHEKILEICDDYCLEKNEYFWDKQPRSFSLVLNLYRKDKLHLPDDLCVMDFAEDLQYWGIDELFLESCCQMKYQQKKETLDDEMKKDEELLIYHKEEDFGKGGCAEYRKYMWDLFEKSITLPQKITGFISIFVIILSIVTLSLSTLPELQKHKCKHDNETLCNEILLNATNPLDPPEEHFDEEDNEILEWVELFCIIWFTLEYLIRLISSPSKSKFFRGWLNAIDLIAIAPFYISLFLVQFETGGKILKVLRVIRILRIFKLARHSTGLQSLGFTLRHSYQNLGVLLLFLGVGVVIFSTLAYFVERHQDNGGFESIPHAFYWACITMTTVGYGDVVPRSMLGKIIGMITGLCGVVVIALPVGIISENFGLFYDEQKRKEKALKRQKAIQDLKDSEHVQGGNYLMSNMTQDPIPEDIKPRQTKECVA